MLLHTGKLEENLTVLLKFLNVGGNDTKLVDTCAEHVGRAAYAVLNFLLE